MAIRQIREKGDEILYKHCKEVKKFDEKLHILLDDMYDTMKEYDGVGLAAPQVGILKRAVVIDISDAEEGKKKGKKRKDKNSDATAKIELINPEIVSESGEQIDNEGCLSVPEVYGEVKRPSKVTVKAQDRNGEWFELTGEGLLARAICHEADHLDGKLFLDKVIKFVERDM